MKAKRQWKEYQRNKGMLVRDIAKGKKSISDLAQYLVLDPNRYCGSLYMPEVIRDLADAGVRVKEEKVRSTLAAIRESTGKVIRSVATINQYGIKDERVDVGLAAQFATAIMPNLLWTPGQYFDLGRSGFASPYFLKAINNYHGKHAETHALRQSETFVSDTDYQRALDLIVRADELKENPVALVAFIERLKRGAA